jgi:hypothetical protein
MIEALLRWIETLFIRLFRRTALRGSSARGEGYIERKDTGARIPFVMWGEATDEVIRTAMKSVAVKLYGPLAGGPGKRMLGAVTHPTAVRTTVADTVVDLIDAGAGAGTLEFQTSGGSECATLTFSDPAYGAASNAVATASAITSDTSATGGTVAKWVQQDSDGNDVILGAASTSGSDINLSSLAVGAGDTVAVSSLTYTAMP